MTSFIFDLDSTVLKGELLPAIAAAAGMDGEAMARKTAEAVEGNAPFWENFPKRAALLAGIPPQEAAKTALAMPRFEKLCAFLREHADVCWIATGNLNLWVDPLVRDLGLEGHCFCSRATWENGKFSSFECFWEKEAAVRSLPGRVVAVGDGMNDVPMLQAADRSVAFGGAHPIPEPLRAAATYAAETEEELVSILNGLLEA